MNSVAVCLGRFQPFHLGHHALITRALDESPHVLICLGSACRARTPRNPFSWQERREMIRVSLSADQNSRITFVPLRDYFNRDRWLDESAKKLNDVLTSIDVCDSTPVRFLGDPTLLSGNFPATCGRWQSTALPRHGSYDGSAIRHALFGELSGRLGNGRASTNPTISLSNVAGLIPASVLDWLENSIGLASWLYLTQEWRAIQNIQESWSQAPFAPTFVTVDAVVRCEDKVLLIRRGKSPGEGLLALPGGFIEQGESIQDAVLRELYEETQIDLDRRELGGLLIGRAVFDHPTRSQFGRVITHGHYFDLGSRACPAVLADDDARMAQWVPITDLRELEDQFHDDHFFILDHFLKLLA